MSKTYRIHRKDKNVHGSIQLSGSKSISNRILIIRALSGKDFKIDNLSRSKDTSTLVHLLATDENELNAGHAGTTFRFLTALLSIDGSERILTGSSRMKERPIGPLVEALRTLGAQIQYLENEGYPPLKIKPFSYSGTRTIKIAGNISSQFISALLLIAPRLPDGLEITIEGDLVSRPYVQMTLNLMESYGIESSWSENTISIHHQDYKTQDFKVEGDWSSASYFYSIAALSDQCELHISNIYRESLQGDSRIAEIATKWDVETVYNEDGITIMKDQATTPSTFEYDFIEVPDIAQSVAIMCGGTGVTGVFSGLKTLKIKETDRIQALKNELAKYHVFFSLLPAKFSKKSGEEYYMVQGETQASSDAVVQTYQDHRMAMAFAPLGLLFPVEIAEVDVVKKSYVDFWDDLKELGFEIEAIEG